MTDSHFINLNTLRSDSSLSGETIALFNTLDGYRISAEEDAAVSVEELKLLDINQNGKFEAREDLLEALNRLTGGNVSGITAQFYDEVRSVLQKYPEVACKAFPNDLFCGGSNSNANLLELIEGSLTTALLSQQSYQGSVVFNASSVRALKEAALAINPRLSTLLKTLWHGYPF